MNEFIIVRTKGLYKIYSKSPNTPDVYQYAGATFVMLTDAQAFLAIKNEEQSDAA